MSRERENPAPARDLSDGREHRRYWKHGQPVTVTGNVSDHEGEDLRAMAGEVCGVNAMCEHSESGEPAVSVELEDGSLASVPERAIERGHRRSFFMGLSPEDHARVFGSS